MKNRIAHTIPELASWPLLVALALTGFLVGIFGTYWDDGWHTDKGRDSFLIAPHVVLYLGISLGGGALSVWALLAASRSGWRRVVVHPPLALALLGVGLTFLAAPIDNAWHSAFGRDAVIWSPPHMLGIAGSLAIAAGLLLELARTLDLDARPWRQVAAFVGAAAVLAVCVLPVLEYETDVPQFAPVFYLPVLTAGSALAFGLITEVLTGKWSASIAALVYTVVMVLIAVTLLAADLPTPLIPLLVLPAAGFDLSLRRLGLASRALLFAALIFLAYLPYLNWIKHGLVLDVSDVAVGFPIAAAAAALGMWLTSKPTGPRRSRPLLATTLLVLLMPTAALAHDPGQGEEIGTADLEVVVADDQATMTISPNNDELCQLQPIAVVARRAGETLRQSLNSESTCRFTGMIPLPERGRWFVYGQFRERGRSVETWLAVDADDGRFDAEDRSVYLPPAVTDRPVKTVAGIAVYSLFAATLIAVSWLYRRQPRAPSYPEANSGGGPTPREA